MSTKKNIQLGKPMKVELGDRYYQFNRQYAIHDIFDVLVELITNSDDSYHRLYNKGKINEDGGPILIEYLRRRGNNHSILKVRDRAEGMTLRQMIQKLGKVEERTSEIGDRGFMGRGAKDCTEFGEMEVESIINDQYYKCKLTTRPELIPLINGEKSTKVIRKRLGILHGNGTVVTLFIDPHHKQKPLVKTIIEKLRWHFALQDILSKNSASKVKIQDTNKPHTRPQPIVHHEPEGLLLIDNLEFEVPEYPEANASLTIYRASEPFDEFSDRRFRRSGLLIKGTRAIHECSLLKPEFERDPYAAHYFGRIECPYIDNLLHEYDEYRLRGESPPPQNPRLLIDPNRQSGLIDDHPFTKALFQNPSERLRSLISKDHKAESTSRKEIANKETKRRLNKLAKAAGQFMKQQLEDIAELTAGEDVDVSAFSERGVVIIPTYVRLKIGEEKKLWMYVKKDLIKSDNIIASIHHGGEELTVLEPLFTLKPHPKKEDRYVGTFRVKANSASDGVYIQATVNGLPKAEAIIEIVEPSFESRDFSTPLEFEHASYRVRHGSTRTIRLFALYPDLVSEESSIKLWVGDSEVAVVRGAYKIIPIDNSNFARAEITIQGRRLNGKTEIFASVNGRDAKSQVKVIQKDQKGVPLKFEFRDEDFNNFRAIWADYEGEPNLLLISARHKSISRYLGPEPDFEGQNSPIFRLLLAEIISESVCRKIMQLDAAENPWDYRLADLKEDHVIVNTVFARLHGRIRDFVADAHSIMLSSRELHEFI